MDYEDYNWDLNDFIDDCFEEFDHWAEDQENQQNQWKEYEDYLGCLESEKEWEDQMRCEHIWKSKDFLFPMYLIYKKYCKYCPPEKLYYDSPYLIFYYYPLQCIRLVKEHLGIEKYNQILDFLIWRRGHIIQYIFMFDRNPIINFKTLDELEEEIKHWNEWTSKTKEYLKIYDKDKIFNQSITNRDIWIFYNIINNKLKSNNRGEKYSLLLLRPGKDKFLYSKDTINEAILTFNVNSYVRNGIPLIDGFRYWKEFIRHKKLPDDKLKKQAAECFLINL
jgi:hypothetical protein